MIENNKYAISVPVNEQMAGSSIYKLTAGYEGLNRYKVDGTDFFESYKVLQKAIADARVGRGPALIEADTIRLFPHSSSDSQKKYRSQKELDEDKQKDPIPRFEVTLLENVLVSRDELDQIKKDVPTLRISKIE